MKNQQKPTLRQFIVERHQQKIPALPLEFEYFPAQVLSKEFTKLNSNHQYRVHYLGPRPLNTLVLHKRYSHTEQKEQQQYSSSQLKDLIHYKHYKVNLRKIINCYFTNERLQQNNHYKSAIFYRAFEGMNPTLPLQQQFIFNSAFESGNLDCVIKVKPNEFDLFLRIDSNTRGNTSWYYFSIKNGNRLQTITLNICNLTKPNLLYEQGMRPFIFSKKAWLQRQKGWDQDAESCKFQQAGLRYDLAYESGSIPITYRICFDYQFQFEDDEVFFAYCVPYTYSELQQDIQTYSSSQYVKKSNLGKTLSGVDLPVLHITNHENNQRNKKNVIITARVHPGETNSSHMLRGFIKFLLGQSKQSEEVRSIANFFIIPMLNPDGVILGNTRTSAAGKDLNREFASNKKELYPEVFHIKNFTAKIHRKYGVFIYIDFHGHSRRKNTFLYGPNYAISHSDYYKCRILPKLIQKIDVRFRFYSCSFMISQQKKTTARAIMLNQLRIPYVYTIQSSLGLFYNPILMKTLPFIKENWQEMGFSIGNGLFNFINMYMEHQNYVKYRKIQRGKMKEQKQQRNFSTKLLNKYKEDELQCNIKGKKGSSLLQILQEVKIVSDQFKFFDEQVQSDDHDEKQELQGYKLNQFNNMVTKGIQRQKNQNKTVKQQEIDFQTFVFPLQEQPDQDQLFESKANMQQASPKKRTMQINKIPQTQDSKRREKSTAQTISSSKIQQNDLRKMTVSQSKEKKASQLKQISTKNFVLKNKQRYSIATKNLFPIEDKYQILSLPRNIQVMRKSMKKGRLLINNLEESRLKFLSIGIKPQQKNQIIIKRQAKAPFFQIEKNRNFSKSSTGTIRLNQQYLNSNEFRIRKSQSHFNQSDPYLTLNGFEVDNRAMTITTFKNFK